MPADATVAQYDRVVGHAERALHELLDQQHGDALVARSAERLEHEVDHLGLGSLTGFRFLNFGGESASTL